MKKSQLKRAVSVALSILMLLAFLPAPTLAEDTEPTPNTYTVLFSVDGAIDASLTQIVEEGATASAPGDPAVPEDEEFTGMSFLYWYAGADSAYDFSTPVTADMTLYAKFGYTEEPESLDPPAALAAEATGSTVNIYIYGGNNYANLIQHYVMTEVTDAKILEYDGIDGIGLLHLLQTDTGYALAGTSAAIPSGDLYKNGQIDLEGGPGVYDVYVYIKTGAVKTTYTVYYKDTLGNTISPDKTVSELAVGDSVTEYAIDISGYALTSASPQTIVLAYSGNDFTFVYAASAYHITYVLNGGENSPLNPATYTVNSETITLADPVRDGYDFTGWLPTNTILSGSSGDKTFTATWTDANVYNITYVLNGGENSPLNPATYTVNSETITLADPTRTGYQFLGWLPTNTILSGSTGDKTFTATWSDAIVYSITYELNGGENDPSNPVSYTVESETITLADPVRDGYDFAGWLPTNTILSGSIGDKTFTATWTDANVYNITYVLNGGENSPLNPATYTVNSETITLADPTRAGYQFLGWSPTNTILSGSTGDITFTATWSDAIVYNITYELNGGENDPSNPVTYTVNSGTITLADPTRDGYIFDGWSPTDTILSGSTEDKTFTALWSGPVAYSITYVLGGGENSPLNPATYTVNSETITLADPTRAGYQFLGWSPTNTILSGSTGDITFTATWSDAIVYNITYELNGGENDPANPVTYTVNSGTIILADPTKAGYYFLGWTPTDTILSGSTEDKTFTANWAEQTALTLTANSAVYNYDAAVKSVSGITPSIAGLTIEGATAGASGIAPGVYQTNFQNQENLVILDGGEDVTERYAVSWVNGSLTVNPRVMYRADASGELLGTEWVAYGTGDATYSVTPPQNVSYNGVNYYWLGAYNPASAEDLTENTTIYALYAQNKPLVITADSASYPYDGSLHTITTGTVSDPAVTVSGYTVYGGGTYAGAYPTSVSIGPDFTILSGAEDVTYQYDVSTVKGTLTILPANTTADSQGYAGIYDGYPHAITVTPAQGGSMVRYSLTYSGDPADYTLTESPAETDFTPGTTVYFVVTNPNYNPVFGSEVIKIDKRTIALTTVSDSKPYDGTALTNPDWSYDAAGNDGFADGEGFTSAAADGTITNVGSIENGFAYTLNASTDPANYAFEITKGTLTVTAADTLTVNAADYSGKYDGLAHGVTASANVSAGTQIYYSADYSANPADYTLTASPTATHVSESKTVYFVAINGNYAPAFGSASITIAPRAILVSTFDANRVYDGTPLTQSGWGFGAASDGFAGGEGFAATNTTGTITNAGSVENGFDYTFSLATRSEDYSVSITPGTLTVTKRAVLVSALNAEKNYSTADPAFGYTYKTGTVNGTTYYAVLAGDLGSVTVSVLRTNTDNYVGIYPGVLAPGVAAAPDVLSNYTFLTAAADFTINPRVIYNTNTVAAVTGFPQTEWFGYGTNAVVADGYGVVRAGYELTGWRDAATGTRSRSAERFRRSAATIHSTPFGRARFTTRPTTWTTTRARTPPCSTYPQPGRTFSPAR